LAGRAGLARTAKTPFFRIYTVPVFPIFLFFFFFCTCFYVFLRVCLRGGGDKTANQPAIQRERTEDMRPKARMFYLFVSCIWLCFFFLSFFLYLFQCVSACVSKRGRGRNQNEISIRVGRRPRTEFEKERRMME